MKGLDVIRECRKNIHPWFPIVDHVNWTFEDKDDFGDVNLGWNAGLLGNVPYFAECWASNGLTMLTVFVSAKLMNGKATADELTEIFVEDKLFSRRDQGLHVEVSWFKDGNGNDFYSYNVVVGDEEGVYLDKLKIEPFYLLNKLNNE